MSRWCANVISPREIRVDHANWLDDGAIYLDDPVADVSADNDWSAVRVWNIKTGAWGGKIYPVQGFIGPGGSDANRPTTSRRLRQIDRSRSPVANLD